MGHKTPIFTVAGEDYSHPVENIAQDMIDKMEKVYGRQDNRVERLRLSMVVDLLGGRTMYTGYQDDLKRVMNMLVQEPVYRIKINEDSSVDTDCFDLLDNFAPELKKHYDDASELPDWVQEKLAVLLVLDPDKINTELAGIGKRINRQVFWVFIDGDDSRIEGQEGSEKASG